MQQDSLVRPGDRVAVPHNEANSWADGTRVVLGQDAIDFELELGAMESSESTVVVNVRHLPPRHPAISLPAEWMREAAADVSNNWVQVTRTREGAYRAAVGKETFDVEIRLSTNDGRIVSGRMTNPVEILERECADQTLAKCGEAARYRILREIELKAVR